VVLTSEIFQALAEEDNRFLQRIEVVSPAFSTLRSNMRVMTTMLCATEDDFALDHADRLRVHLLEWLTCPIPFTTQMADVILSLGTTEDVSRRWGETFGAAHNAAYCAVLHLAQVSNPVRGVLRQRIDSLRARNAKFRIFCHRRSIEHFHSLFEDGEPVLTRECFLHTVRDYAKTEPFEALLKVGPMRARGWGSVPDAVANAPRFNELIQVVWSGCNDDKDFGYDPGAASFTGDSPRRGRLHSWTAHRQIVQSEPGDADD
jgi:hypothetical protein